MVKHLKMRALSATRGHDAAKLKAGMADKVSSAVMMVDRDFVVTYVKSPPANC